MPMLFPRLMLTSSKTERKQDNWPVDSQPTNPDHRHFKYLFLWVDDILVLKYLIR